MQGESNSFTLSPSMFDEQVFNPLPEPDAQEFFNFKDANIDDCIITQQFGPTQTTALNLSTTPTTTCSSPLKRTWDAAKEDLLTSMVLKQRRIDEFFFINWLNTEDSICAPCDCDLRAYFLYWQNTHGYDVRMDEDTIKRRYLAWYNTWGGSVCCSRIPWAHIHPAVGDEEIVLPAPLVQNTQGAPCQAKRCTHKRGIYHNV